MNETLSVSDMPTPMHDSMAIPHDAMDMSDLFFLTKV